MIDELLETSGGPSGTTKQRFADEKRKNRVSREAAVFLDARET